MKLLTLNAGYFLGFDGMPADYIKHPLRTVVGDKKSEQRSTERFQNMIEEERPDAVMLQEIDQGSIRSRNTPHTIEEQLPVDYRVHAETKYGGLTGKTPFMGKMSNGVFTTRGKVENHFLENGTKNLVQELKLEDLSVFSVHLSRFGSRVREKQLREIAEIAEQRSDHIVAGDFNFMSEKEHAKAEKILGEKVSPGKTFPSKDPFMELDMAFTSDTGIEAEVLDHRISDHRPVVFEIPE